MHGAEPGSQLVSVTGLQVRDEVSGLHAGQQGVAEVRGIPFRIEGEDGVPGPERLRQRGQWMGAGRARGS